MSRAHAVRGDARAASVLAVAEDVFTTMVDGEPGHLRLRDGAPAPSGGRLHAWVDITGTYPVRVVLAAGHGTARRLAQALTGCGPDEAVDDAEVADAFGEVANMLGGNLKGTLPPGSRLGLPAVADGPPAGEHRVDVTLDWRGDEIVISMLALTRE
jgi:chemotaxis protein CheX